MHQKQSQGRHQKGLTAIELLVTLAILAILIGIAAPSMARFIAQWRVSNAINAFTGSLRIARTEAIARGRPVVLCRVNSSTSTTCQASAGSNGFASGWIVFVNNDRNTGSTFSASNGDELLVRQDAPGGISDITFTGTGAPKFVFQPNGLAATAAAINFDAAGFDASSTPWARKAICISKPGRIRYVADSVDCDDNG